MLLTAFKSKSFEPDIGNTTVSSDIINLNKILSVFLCLSVAYKEKLVAYDLLA